MIALLALLACAPEREAVAPGAPKGAPEERRGAGARSGAGRPAPSTPPGLPTETDLPYGGAGAWTLGGVRLTLAETTLRADGEVVLERVYHAPLAGADVLWVPADRDVEDGGIHAVTVADGQVRVTTLVAGGRPDRLVLAPDGATLLYVAGHTGLTSVWAVPVAGGQPRQLTNVGLEKPVGRAPEGFVPPWERAAPTFAGDRATWEARGATWEAAWR